MYNYVCFPRGNHKKRNSIYFNQWFPVLNDLVTFTYIVYNQIYKITAYSIKQELTK